MISNAYRNSSGSDPHAFTVEYIKNVEVCGIGPGADDHKVLYNYNSLNNLLLSCGFEVELLEWFDENGIFHKSIWDIDYGKIYRSKKFGEPNKSFSSSHLSLILDGIKNSNL